MHVLEEETLGFIGRWNLLKPGQRVLVAVSGGKDSMALLNILWNLSPLLSIELVAANLDHGLRERGPSEEAEMIKRICIEKGIAFFHERRDVKDYMSKVPGLSVEEAARKVRYDFLREVKNAQLCDVIAVAHNRDDLTETMLLRMARGTGLKGVVGLRPSNGDIVRPLLFCDMQRIMDYVTINMVTFMEDETNLDTSFDRNSVRLKIVPEFKRLNPSFNEAMWRFFENLYDGYSIVERDVKEALSSFKAIDGILFVESVILKGAYRALLFETVREIVSRMSSDGYPPSRERVEAFYDLLMSDRNGWTVEFREDLKSSRLGDYVFFYKKGLVFETLEAVEVFSLPFEFSHGVWRLRIREGGKPFDRLDGRFLSVCGIGRMALPLKLRPVDKKDSIVPFGMSRTRRVERIVAEKGMKGFWSKLMVLENAKGEILWVPGVVTSELCRADPSYTELAVFSLERR